MEIDHIGFLSKDIEKSIQAFMTLGFKQTTRIIDDVESLEKRGVRLCFLENDDVKIELVSPIDTESVVYNVLKRQGEGPYHICYRTAVIDKAIEELKREAWVLLKAPAPAVAFNNARVAFLFRKGAGMIELLEAKP